MSLYFILVISILKKDRSICSVTWFWSWDLPVIQILEPGMPTTPLMKIKPDGYTYSDFYLCDMHLKFSTTLLVRILAWLTEYLIIIRSGDLCASIRSLCINLLLLLKLMFLSIALSSMLGKKISFSATERA